MNNREFGLLILFFLFLPFRPAPERHKMNLMNQTDDFTLLREKMVTRQLEARGITDRSVLHAFRTVERHRFVLPEYQMLAYSDQPLPIKEDQTISQPYVVAFMTEQLDLKKKDKVLEVGTGSGYQAAILAQLCDTVYTIEIFKTLVQDAKELFRDLGYHNIYVKQGDGYLGWPEHAPFDAIIVTCSPTRIPDPLVAQLAEGGRLIIPVGRKFAQNLVLIRKKKGRLTQQKVLPVRFVPMINEDGKSY
jgi:protein-L-isoaspartate(D-aspartate) O-methyltransferase